MSVIKPFKGLKPTTSFIKKVVLNHLDNPFSQQNPQWLSNNPESFLHLLDPEIDVQKHESRFGNIIVKLKHFLQNHILERDHNASFYIYRVILNNESATGIWTCTLLDDYLNGTIKKHEYTQPEKEHQLYQFIQETGLDCIPVLITYEPNKAISSFIKDVTSNLPSLSFIDDTNRKHDLWVIDQPENINFLKQQFKGLASVYIADGHHRAAAFSAYGLNRRKHNQRHNGSEEYNFCSSIYFAADELKIYSYSRLIKADLETHQVLDYIQKNFRLETVMVDCYYPKGKGEYGLWADGKWFKFNIPVKENDVDPVKKLDVSSLQDLFLSPVFGINDPRNDNRLGFAPGTHSCSVLMNKIKKEGYNYAITMFPVSVEELMSVADSGGIMPPKSTWFEPKMPLGLVTHFID
ncbi:DUF1015 family protein [Solitalea sp. MAHUQ-68]|uniref:DUF1015 family protein n=1 Tax=Solitalea agri TaxID=2953739 RepID=A0A9X2JE62_9SPHI|nr:DUF1015 family protein [Solitalea agri]MCO4294399.1 DUF1015 family protein [Solitalea agri]